jgi:predicted RNA-binding Zn-ribbon protein involved in translation (DUF1610 family)
MAKLLLKTRITLERNDFACIGQRIEPTKRTPQIAELITMMPTLVGTANLMERFATGWNNIQQARIYLQQSNTAQVRQKKTKTKRKCVDCGNIGRHNTRCRFVKCYKCNKNGHIASSCPNNQSMAEVGTEVNEFDYSRDDDTTSY